MDRKENPSAYLLALLQFPAMIIFSSKQILPLNKMSALTDIVSPGVVTGDDLLKLLEHARVNKYAIPAVNCTR